MVEREDTVNLKRRKNKRLSELIFIIISLCKVGAMEFLEKEGVLFENF